MIKCGVCGSENEAAALFCGVCGSPLKAAEDVTAAQEVAQPVVPTPEPTGDDAVVPGKGGARRDLGIGGEAKTTVPKPQPTPDLGTDTTMEGSGPTIVCSVCGTVNDAARTYCRKCANELKPMAAPPPPPPEAAPRKGISPLALGLGAAGVVLVGGAVVLAMSGVLSPQASASPVAVSPGTSGVPASPDASVGAPTEPPFGEGDPEGRLVFARCDSDDVCSIILVDLATGEEEQLTEPQELGSTTDPAFSHDGNRVAFSTPEGIRILDLDSGDISPHSSGPEDVSADWSSDDSRLVFAAARQREAEPNEDREIRIDGVTVTGPSEPLTLNGVDDHDGVFTPDDASVIWVQGRGNSRELMRIDLESRDVTPLTDDDFNDVDPAVSPDGTLLAFVSNRESGPDGPLELFVMDLETGDVTRLGGVDGDAHDPAWSPLGRYIVFSGGDDDARRDLFLLDRGDGSIRPLVESPEREATPAWRP